MFCSDSSIDDVTNSAIWTCKTSQLLKIWKLDDCIDSTQTVITMYNMGFLGSRCKFLSVYHCLKLYLCIIFLQ